jgi:hypothetical protein
MATKFSLATMLNGRHDLELAKTDVSMVPFSPRRPARTKNIRYF